MGDKIIKSKNLCCQPVVFPSLSLLNFFSFVTTILHHGLRNIFFQFLVGLLFSLIYFDLYFPFLLGIFPFLFLLLFIPFSFSFFITFIYFFWFFWTFISLSSISCFLDGKLFLFDLKDAFKVLQVAFLIQTFFYLTPRTLLRSNELLSLCETPFWPQGHFWGPTSCFLDMKLDLKDSFESTKSFPIWI